MSLIKLCFVLAFGSLTVMWGFSGHAWFAALNGFSTGMFLASLLDDCECSEPDKGLL